MVIPLIFLYRRKISDRRGARPCCLGEISSETAETLNHVHNVHPSEVRKQTGSFGAAFARHEKRLMAEMDKVLRWKAALTEAANLSGWDLTSAKHRYEAKVIKKIVRKILEHLNNPLFLEEPVKEESKFKPFSGAARRLGKYVTELAAPVVKEDQLLAADRTSSGNKHPRRLAVGSNDPKKSTKLSKKDVKGEALKKEEQKFQPFTGKKYALMGPPQPAAPFTSKKAPVNVEEEPVKEESKFKPFSGAARRLGDYVTELAAPVVKEDQLLAADRTSSGNKHPRRLAVGSNDPKKSTKLSKKDVKRETLKKEEQKFQPFTGKKYTLMG